MTEIINRTAAPTEILERKRSMMAFLRNALIEGDPHCIANALTFLPLSLTLRDFLKLVSGVVDLAGKPLPEIPMAEASPEELEAVRLYQAIRYSDDDAISRSCDLLEALFAGLFPTSHDTPGFPVPPPAPGVLEGRWEELVGNTARLNWLCSERFGICGSSLRDPVLEIVHKIMALREAHGYEDSASAGLALYRWQSGALRILERCWPVVNDLKLIGEVLTERSNELALAALNCVSAMGRHAQPLEEMLTDFLDGVSPRTVKEMPEEFDREGSSHPNYRKLIVWNALECIVGEPEESAAA